MTNHTNQITGVATAVAAMRDAQQKIEEWQTQIADKMAENDRLIAGLQAQTKKEPPRHKQARVGDPDASMLDAPAPTGPQTHVPGQPASSSIGEPTTRRPQRSSSVPARGSKGDPEVTLLQFPEATTRTRAQAWLRDNIEPVAGLPDYERARALDSHVFITYELDSFEEADDFA